ncbi:MAG TPA: dipeptide epimerase [Chitinophagaceae bacterium]|nr:dipeptide epimerase [Chitinophagaceae bacterium]
MQIRYWSHSLRFRHPFTISKGTKTHQPTLIVELQHLGFTGYGEAPAISYYDITVEKMIADLEAKRPVLEKFAFTVPERYWHFLHHLFPRNSFLICALDMAGWDLFGKMRRTKLYECWKADPRMNDPLTDYTIGIDTPEKMVEKIRERPWPIYKIKVGTPNDLALLQELRKHTDAVFRVDANAGWDLKTALTLIPRLSDLGVQLVEQPLAKDAWADMSVLYELSPLPLIADESCVTGDDVEKCAGKFHGINIKLTKCGGPTPALEMIRMANKLQMEIMIGCMNESTVGTAAIAHLTPLANYADLDGPLLLAEDVATGIRYDNGKVVRSEEPGLGIRYTGATATEEI